ncbi:MAG: serine/threonine protein kinase [Labilithrix sp.]|nr:serine/threonine protein kinase [Labilithrix sp.]
MDPTQLQPGYRLDRYELLCPLAYGGMASVWLARFGGRLGFERMVVVKMILPQYSQDPRFQEMFLDEARIASKIEHTNVARILDVGEHQESYFIVMEWVDGDSLSKVLRAAEQQKQRLPSGIALRIVADAAAGLHAAHELKERDGTHLGVVHRDVSPQNILVANNGTTVIIDFGVAKARDRVSQETSAGQLKGKIRYMAPEQALGRTIDHRADVWALGAMLYEMFTGQPPYDGPNEVATLHKLTSGQRPSPMPPTIAAPLRAVVERALGYEPEERFATALELNVALEAAMLEINEPTTPAMVAQYTAKLLADRKAARKRAVDAALENAKKRDGHKPAAPLAPSIPAPGRPPPGPPPLPAARNVVPIVQGEAPSAPSAASNPVSFSEIPSATSSTLGSANMEYYPAQPAFDDGPRPRRYLAAAALGVSVAAGVIGAILIVTTVARDGKSAHRAGAGGGDIATASTEAPAETTETTAATAPPTTVTAPPTETTAPPADTAAPAPAESAATPETAATDDDATIERDDPPTARPNNSAAKPAPPATTSKPKPAAPTAPTPTRVDRGF